ncbi:ventrally expressed dharma/bozozok antagonist [Syngnathus acus]|uniref:ventrally expressed dharma/bozozok antagonist n=1 Tax=Syngnathus acus TaxID=161584 RepID=UPI00188618F2|nr:ventrally expressed dharma/bozozok antagonist [Syngnathus acus]XP_037122092.1 ventrally expressed dharma/bozozok antagonist [Syngnathus acus]
MRGHFSIEWMAQSSRQRPAASVSGAALAGASTESLPGFYRRALDDSGGAPAKRPKMDTKSAPEAEEETSGYESERSLSPPPPTPPSGRRPRTAFTAEQIGSLERAFKRNAYLGTQDKAQLCSKLNLSDKQIRNWFQNRRMKLKRTVQDALAAHACQASAASRFGPYPELRGFGPAPYPLYHHPVPLPLQDDALAQPSPHNLQYASPLDPLYRHGGVPGAAVLPGAAATSPSPTPPPLMAAYAAYY